MSIQNFQQRRYLRHCCDQNSQPQHGQERGQGQGVDGRKGGRRAYRHRRLKWCHHPSPKQPQTHLGRQAFRPQNPIFHHFCTSSSLRKQSNGEEDGREKGRKGTSGESTKEDKDSSLNSQLYDQLGEVWGGIDSYFIELGFGRLVCQTLLAGIILSF